jgi:hypothetical protein
MNVQGKIKLIGETQTFGSGFTKRQLVVETTEDQYPQVISIDFVKDKCDILDKYQVGQSVDVSVNLGGREWINPQGEAKYFNSLTGWRIESLAQAAPSQISPTEQFQPSPDLTSEEPDDLPF